MKYKKIGEITTVVTGGTPSTSVDSYWLDGQIPWLQSGCCQNCDVDKAEKFITKEGYNNSSTRMMPKDTVMIALTGATAGKIGYLNIEACGNQSITGILPCEEINQRYLFYYLLSQRSKILSDCIGGAQPHISQGYVKNLLIPILNIQEQIEIVKILTKVSKIIKFYQEELQKFDELIKARFVEMFGDIQHEQKYKGIPLRDLCTTISGGTPSTKFPEYYQGNIPWISTVSLGPNHIDGTTAKGYITSEAIANSATKLIPAGNILFGTRVGVGKSSINDVDMCTNQDIVAIISLDEARFNKLFIKHVLDQYQPHFDSLKKGATILGITSEDLKNILIPNVPIDLQLSFEKFTEEIDKAKSVVQNSLDETQNLFNSLMQEYFG